MGKKFVGLKLTQTMLRQPRNAERRKKSLLQGRTNQLLI